MRILAALLLVLVFVAGWFFLPKGGDVLPDAGATLVASPPAGRSEELAMVRASLEASRLDLFINEQAARCEREPQVGEHWRVLAEAYLERALLPDLELGLAVGKPNRDELPPAVEADVEQGMLAIERAIELGDETAEAYRVLCALLSRQIVGFASLMRLNGRIDEAVERAIELDASNARVLVTLGCRKLFAPKMFGHDPEGSLPYLLSAADALEHDERPLLYAAFAYWLQGDGQAARAMLVRAIARTPANSWARVVMQRLDAGDEEPFRDL